MAEKKELRTENIKKITEIMSSGKISDLSAALSAGTEIGAERKTFRIQRT